MAKILVVKLKIPKGNEKMWDKFWEDGKERRRRAKSENKGLFYVNQLRDVSDSNTIVLIEKWTSKEARDDYFSSFNLGPAVDAILGTEGSREAHWYDVVAEEPE